MSHFELKFIVVVYDARWYLAVTKIVHVVGDGISTRQSMCICFFGRSCKICSLYFALNVMLQKHIVIHKRDKPIKS